MQPLVSVLVTSYNKCHYLERSLNSIVNQTNFPLGSIEIVVVDDNSKDNSFDVARSFLGKYQEIASSVHRNSENRGPSYTRNVAMESARGSFYVHLDGDDILHQDCLSEVDKAFQNKSSVGFVYSDHASINANFKGIFPTDEDIFKVRDNKPDFDLRGFLEGDFNYVGFVRSVRASQALPFDESLKYSEDVDWIIEHGLAKIEFFHIPKILYYWRRDTGGISDSFIEQERNYWHNLVFNRGIKKLEKSK